MNNNTSFRIMNNISLLLVSLIVMLPAGCAKTDIKRTTYNALQDRQCIEETGHPNCDSNDMSYDEYQEQRTKQ